MLPVTFGDCFGWLHPGGRTCGVVLCGPIGFEKQVFHRSLRLMADRLGDAGYSTLRFDYPGTGDAAGVAGASDEHEAWLSGIEAATAWLRQHAGATRVVLCGVELGALLAGVSAARMGGVDQLVLIAPVTSGRTYVRTFRLAAKLSAAELSGQGAGCPPRRAGPGAELSAVERPDASARQRAGASGQEAVAADPHTASEGAEITEAHGLLLHETTLRALTRLDLGRLPTVPAPDVLLLDATGLDSVGALCAALANSGAKVTRLDMPDYLHMARQAHESELPVGSFNRILAWLQQTEAPEATPVPLPRPAFALLRGIAWTERPVLLNSSGGETAAVLCRPVVVSEANSETGVSPDPPAVLIVNTGANPRYGYGRFAVTLARALAADGVMSLRLDMAGCGDSVWNSADQRPHLFADRSPDIAAGLAFLATEGAPASIGFGICSGAFQIFRAALSDRRLCGLMLVNQPIYHPPISLSRNRHVRRLRALCRRLRGRPATPVNEALEQMRRIPPVRTRTRILARLIGLARVAEDALLRPFGLHTALSFPRRVFEQLAERGAPVLVVVGDNDPGHLILQAHFGPMLAGLRGIAGYRVLVEPQFDHPVGDSSSQRRLVTAVLAFLTRRRGDFPEVA